MTNRLSRFLSFSFLFFYITLGACSPTTSKPESSPEPYLPKQVSEIDDVQVSDIDDVQVEVSWTYQDDYRLGLEITIENYFLPNGFRTRCPITRLLLTTDEKDVVLYKNPEQIDLGEFYSLIKTSNWVCEVKEATTDKVSIYIFSLSYFYPSNDNKSYDFTDSMINIELGEVIADNSASVITLASQGNFQLSLGVIKDEKSLTWFPSERITVNEVAVQINRVSVNPSLVLMDACIEYNDHHYWRPRASLRYQEKSIVSEERIPLSSDPDYRGESQREKTNRCYSFYIPLNPPYDLMSSFYIGIEQIQIDNTFAAHIRRTECEKVKFDVEKTYSGLEIKCVSYETRGQPQEWFEIISRPDDLSHLEAYSLVESAFIITINGSWEIELDLEN